MGVSERYDTERNEKAPKKWRGPFMITEECTRKDVFID